MSRALRRAVCFSLSDSRLLEDENEESGEGAEADAVLDELVRAESVGFASLLLTCANDSSWRFSLVIRGEQFWFAVAVTWFSVKELDNELRSEAGAACGASSDSVVKLEHEVMWPVGLLDSMASLPIVVPVWATAIATPLVTLWASTADLYGVRDSDLASWSASLSNPESWLTMLLCLDSCLAPKLAELLFAMRAATVATRSSVSRRVTLRRLSRNSVSRRSSKFAGSVEQTPSESAWQRSSAPDCCSSSMGCCSEAWTTVGCREVSVALSELVSLSALVSVSLPVFARLLCVWDSTCRSFSLLRNSLFSLSRTATYATRHPQAQLTRRYSVVHRAIGGSEIEAYAIITCFVLKIQSGIICTICVLFSDSFFARWNAHVQVFFRVHLFRLDSYLLLLRNTKAYLCFFLRFIWIKF